MQYIFSVQFRNILIVITFLSVPLCTVGHGITLAYVSTNVWSEQLV